MRKLFLACATTIIALGALPFAASAQPMAICGAPYAPADRAKLRIYLYDNLRFMSVMFYLAKLANQAALTTTTPAERVTLNNEYQSLVAAVATWSTWSPPWMKPRTRAWLKRIINPNFLNLTGTSLLTVEGAESATARIWGYFDGGSAMEKFMICY